MSDRRIRSIELLAPARDLPTGLTAIDHGADAIYIGAPAFGARQAVGVSIGDIAELCRYAHLFRVKVLVALNTILYDKEIPQAVEIIRRLYTIGVDAVIIQDRGLLSADCDLPPIPLHASTQCDTRTAIDVRDLESMGIERVVLARELSVREIDRIRQQTTVDLEAFVHGALCVSYSGACYLSAATTGRSANRGACSQPCRLPYDLIDASGRILIKAQHLLSLRDLNRSKQIGEMIEAGISSLKIEGRLKSTSYVKNVTAYYHLLLEDIIQQQPDRYKRAAAGEVELKFDPDPSRSFNRGFTNYLLNDPKRQIVSPESPKSKGRYVGDVRHVQQEKANIHHLLIQMNEIHDLHNGDGLLTIDEYGQVRGCRVNDVVDAFQFRVDSGVTIRKGAKVYCNYDSNFEKQLSGHTATRLIAVQIRLRPTPHGLAMDIQGAPSYPSTSTAISITHTIAHKPQAERIRTELSKLGGTILYATDIDISGCQDLFIPASALAALRRQAAETFVRAVRLSYERPIKRRSPLVQTTQRPQGIAPYSANIANRFARKQYEQMGYRVSNLAFELAARKDIPLMTTKLCIRRKLGYCPRLGEPALPYPEPLYLRPNRSKEASSNQTSRNQRLRLSFDCEVCQMRIYQAD